MIVLDRFARLAVKGCASLQLTLGILLAASAHAAPDPNKDFPTWNMSMFSRANCINNESISWDSSGSSYWNLYTTSLQTNLDDFTQVFVTAGPAVTWRSAAISWFAAGEGFWQVEGDHQIQPAPKTDENEGWALIATYCPNSFGGATDDLEDCVKTLADNCSF